VITLVLVALAGVLIIGVAFELMRRSIRNDLDFEHERLMREVRRQP
jgi:hypothetical protein